MTTKILRHPDPVTLMGFAAGNLAEPLAAVVAGHLDLCPACRAEISDIELLGAALLANAEPARPQNGAMVVPARPVDRRPCEVVRYADPSGRLPLPLASAFRLSYDKIPWRLLGPGVWHHRLPLSPGVAGDLRLLQIAPGRVMPEHGHGGAELTLVLDGAYSDETGSYRRGDIQDVDQTVDHTPIADKAMGCVCLIASEQPARFKSLLGRLVQPFTGM